MAQSDDCCRTDAQLHSQRPCRALTLRGLRRTFGAQIISVIFRDGLMLRKLSLALAVSCASNGMAWAAEAPLSTKTDLVSVYQEACLLYTSDAADE